MTKSSEPTKPNRCAPPVDESVLILSRSASRAKRWQRKLHELGILNSLATDNHRNAIRKAVRNEFDLALVDVSSEGEGPDSLFLEAVRKEAPGLVVVALLAKITTETMRRCFDAGVWAVHAESEADAALHEKMQQVLKRRDALFKYARSAAQMIAEDSGLSQRSSLVPDIERIVENRSKSGTIALAIVDIDDFTGINHHHSYAFGNDLLKATFEVLAQSASDALGAYRWGDDEVALVFTGFETSESALARSREVQENACRVLNQRDLKCHLTLSVGLSFHDDGKATPEKLIREAEIAMAESKKQGGNTCTAFNSIADPEMQLRLFSQRRRLRLAIESGDIDVFFQPIVEPNGTPRKIEALARWVDGDLGFVSPGVFIPLAEEMELVHELCLTVLRKAVLARKSLCEKGYPLSCSINVSRTQLDRPELVEEFLRILREHDEDPSNITIEITETASYVDEQLAQALLKGFQSAGFNLSIDDFGTGQSTFNQLSQISFNELKIDRSLVSAVRSASGLYILRSIIEMAKKLNMAIVAEGVEDPISVNLLRSMEVDRFQGFYFARPMAEEKLVEFLGKDHNHILNN